MISPALQMRLAEKHRRRFMDAIVHHSDGDSHATTAARTMTLVNVVDMAVLLAVVWAMYAKPEI